MKLQEALKEHDNCDTIIIIINETGYQDIVKQYGEWIKDITKYPNYRTLSTTTYGKHVAIITIKDMNE